MISEAVLPPKGHLIKQCKEEYGLDHAALRLTGIPVHKDRVVLALYLAELTRGQSNTSDPQSVIDTFTELLGSRSKLVSEFQSYCVEQLKSSSASAAKAPKYRVMSSLEVNLMLVFLWLGCLTSDLPLLEKDILEQAQDNSFGYLSEHVTTSHMLFRDSRIW